MILEPIIKAKLANFKKAYECTLPDDQAFERFANWVILERHQPNAFTSDPALMEDVCVGGDNDTGIDGICIKINNSLIKSLTEAKELVASQNKITIDFIFIQSKNKNSFKQNEYNQFLTGIKDFVGPKQYQPQNRKLQEWQKIKNYLMSDDCCAKWADNPTLYIYYVFLGEGVGSQHIKSSEQRFRDEIKRLNVYGPIIIENINSKNLKKYCDENENKYDAQITVLETCSFFGENEQILGIDSNSTIAVCRASELLRLLISEDGLLRKGIFDDNVRDFQGETTINNEIRETIEKAPSNFVLYNNGITIVCENIITNGKNLVIKNPRIVNGCQTCNVIYNSRLVNKENLSSIKVVLKIISTSDESIINQVVRGTNRQNIVQDEAFETIREFHKNLENFFLAANQNYAMPLPIYYERRSRQYENMKINETAKVRFSVLIRSFVSIILSEPHRNVSHPATLQKDFKNKIFIDNQSLLPYYVAAQVNASIERAFRKEKLAQDVKAFKPQLAYLFCLNSNGFIPSINNPKQIDTYSEQILKILKQTPLFESKLNETIQMFRKAKDKWVETKGDEYKFGIKDSSEFTEFLKNYYRNSTTSNFEQEYRDLQRRGKVQCIKQNIKGQWFGFIKTSDGDIYFNNQGIESYNFTDLLGKDVLYDIGENRFGPKAINIKLI